MKTTVTHMGLPRTILVGVDDAGLSDHALRAAFELGSRLGARVELVHAVRSPAFEWSPLEMGPGPVPLEDLLAAASRSVNDHLRALELPRPRETSGDPVRVVPGVPAAALLRAAREQKADWIVLGTHERRGWIDFGSTARAVLAKSELPVWIQSRPVQPITRILAPVDLSEESMQALSLACALAEALEASVHAVHFFDVASLYATTPDALGFMPRIAAEDVRAGAVEKFGTSMSAFDWRGVRHTTQIADGKAVAGILELAAASDLVVMGTHGRTGLAAAILGGVAQAVLRHAEVAVLAVPYPRRKFVL